MTQSVPIDQVFTIPELLQKIFSNCTPQQLGLIARVCKTFRKAADEDALWKSYCKRDFPHALKDSDDRSSQKEFYLRQLFFEKNLKTQPGCFRNPIPCHEKVWRVHLGADCRFYAILGTTIQVWNPKLTERIESIPIDRDAPVTAIASTKDRLFLGTMLGSIKAWETGTYANHTDLPPSTVSGQISALHVSASHLFAAIANWICIWDAASLALETSIQCPVAPPAPIHHLAVNAQSCCLAAAWPDPFFSICQRDENHYRSFKSTQSDASGIVGITTIDSYFCLFRSSGKVEQWDVQKGTSLTILNHVSKRSSHDKSVHPYCSFASGRLYLGHPDGIIFVLQENRCLGSFQDPKALLELISVDPTGMLMVVRRVTDQNAELGYLPLLATITTPTPPTVYPLTAPSPGAARNSTADPREWYPNTMLSLPAGHRPKTQPAKKRKPNQDRE